MNTISNHQLIISVFLFFSASDSFSQDNTLLSVSSNFIISVPNAPRGTSVTFRYKNAGIYLDYKYGRINRETVDFFKINPYVVQSAPPKILGRQASASIYDFGICYEPLENVICYGGFGRAYSWKYVQYSDTNHLNNEGNDYFRIEKDKRINFSGGILFLSESGISFQLGMDFPTFGVVYGIGYNMAF